MNQIVLVLVLVLETESASRGRVRERGRGRRDGSWRGKGKGEVHWLEICRDRAIRQGKTGREDQVRLQRQPTRVVFDGHKPPPQFEVRKFAVSRECGLSVRGRRSVVRCPRRVAPAAKLSEQALGAFRKVA